MEKLNIEPKINNGTRQKLIDEGLIASEETVSNDEFNALVGKTNELVEAVNAGAPITAFNFLENVPTYEDLPISGNQVNDGYGVLEDGLIYVWNGLSFQSKGNGMDLGLKPKGVVEPYNLLAVTGGEVYEKLPILEGNNLFKPDLLVFGKSINSVGVVKSHPSYSDIAIIEKLRLKPNSKYTIGNYKTTESKYLSVVDANDNVLMVKDSRKLPIYFETDATHFYLNATIKNAENTTPDTYLNTILVQGHPSTLTSKVSKINASYIEDLNALTREEFMIEGLKEIDLTLLRSKNLANKKYYLDNFMVADAGIYPDREGWGSFKIPITPDMWGKNICVGNFKINDGGYSHFFNGKVSVLYNGSYTTANLPKKYLIPVNCDAFYISVKRPSNKDSDYKNIIINIGNELIPYEEPIDTITAIKGYKLSTSGSGGNSFNQSLNTFDNVEFNMLTLFSMFVDYEQWDEISPTNIAIGQGYVKIPEGQIKVRLQ